MAVPAHPFDWLIPDRLAACVHPALGPQMAALLQQHQIGCLVNLHERADGPDLLARLNARAVHLPVVDFTPPTQEQLEQGVAAIRAALESGTRVAVHCGAGLGRTGTLLAAYLVSGGTPADDAIAQVRAARPGSIETAEQEQAVRQFAAPTTSSGGRPSQAGGPVNSRAT